MAEENRKQLLQIASQPGNDRCADCGDKDPQWACLTLGLFVCLDCAGIHRVLSLRVKSIKLDNWDREQVDVMRTLGNDKAKESYETCIPPFYRRPTIDDVHVLKKEWILAKYERKEFISNEQQDYDCPKKEGILFKLGRDRKTFQPRKFCLNRANNKLEYYVNEQLKPKEEINLDDVNAVFVPEKIGHPNGMQITFLKNGSTRNLFVHSESSKDIVDWYYAIRAAKLDRRKIAFPDRNIEQLAEDLTKDFLIEGWLYKMGPRNEPFKRRWFILDKRKLMYFEEPLNAFPKGEVFIGNRESDYSVTRGATEGKGGSPNCFTLHTPDRNFVLKAEMKEDMDKWVDQLQRVVEMPLTPQDSKMATLLVAKKPFNPIRR